MKSTVDAIDLGSTDEDEPPAKRLAIARDGEWSSRLGVLAWNAGGLCPQASMESKLPKIAPLLSSDEDIIFVPEASLSTVEKVLKRQLAVRDAYPGYLFRYSQSGKMAVYIKENIATTITVSFPEEPAINGSVAMVRHVGGTWAAVGVYAPNMRVKRSPGSKGVDVDGRLAFDEALFELLEQLAGVPKVALVGDLKTSYGRARAAATTASSASGGRRRLGGSALASRWTARVPTARSCQPTARIEAHRDHRRRASTSSSCVAAGMWSTAGMTAFGRSSRGRLMRAERRASASTHRCGF